MNERMDDSPLKELFSKRKEADWEVAEGAVGEDFLTVDPELRKRVRGKGA